MCNLVILRKNANFRIILITVITMGIQQMETHGPLISLFWHSHLQLISVSNLLGRLAWHSDNPLFSEFHSGLCSLKYRNQEILQKYYCAQFILSYIILYISPKFGAAVGPIILAPKYCTGVPGYHSFYQHVAPQFSTFFFQRP